MPAKSVSKSQHRFMEGVAHGSIAPPKGMTKQRAAEFVKGDKVSKLPEKAKKKK